MKLSVLLVILFFLSSTGCKTMRPVVEKIKTDTIVITELERDTSVIIMPDSAIVRARFECDSLNQVIMTDLAALQGSKIKPVVMWKKSILEVVAKVDSQAVYFSWKDKYIRETVVESTKETIVKTEKPFWPRFWPLGLRAGACLLFGFILFKLFFKQK
jgi:hypothetical protein